MDKVVLRCLLAGLILMQFCIHQVLCQRVLNSEFSQCISNYACNVKGANLMGYVNLTAEVNLNLDEVNFAQYQLHNFT